MRDALAHERLGQRRAGPCAGPERISDRAVTWSSTPRSTSSCSRSGSRWKVGLFSGWASSSRYPRSGSVKRSCSNVSFSGPYGVSTSRSRPARAVAARAQLVVAGVHGPHHARLAALHHLELDPGVADRRADLVAARPRARRAARPGSPRAGAGSRRARACPGRRPRAPGRARARGRARRRRSRAGGGCGGRSPLVRARRPVRGPGTVGLLRARAVPRGRGRSPRAARAAPRAARRAPPGRRSAAAAAGAPRRSRRAARTRRGSAASRRAPR